MNCPKCNAPLAPNQRFCGACGADVSAAAAPVLDTQKTMAAEEYTPDQAYQPQEPAYQPQQPAYQPEQPAYQPEQPAYQPEQPAYQPEQPAYQPQESYYQPEQPAYQAQDNYYQPEQQSYYQPQNQGYGQNAQPASPTGGANDYSQQFSQYQQHSPYGSTNNGYSYQNGATAVKTNKTVMIVVIAVISAVAIAGIVLAIVFGVRGCSGNDIHTVKTSSGVVIATDDAIDTSDSDAKQKIDSYLTAQNAQAVIAQSMGNQGTVDQSVQGNTWVIAVRLNQKLTEAQKTDLKTYINSALPFSSSDMRSQSGVSNMVMVVAYLDSDGSVAAARVIK